MEWEVNLAHTLQRHTSRGVGNGWASRRHDSSKKHSSSKNESHTCRTLSEEQNEMYG